MNNKFFIVGSGGAGKSTLASILSEQQGIPSFELDQLFWNDAWVVADADVFQNRVSLVVSQSQWILDGNYRGTVFNKVYSAADTLVWVNFPRRVVVYRCAVRALRMLVLRRKFYGKDLPPTIWGSIKLLGFVWKTFHERNLFLAEQIKNFEFSGRRTFVLKSKSDINAFLEELCVTEGNA